MRKVVVLALLAIPIILVLTLPVSLIVPLLDAPSGLGQVRGTAWAGSARLQQPGQVPLNLSWRWQGGRYWRWQATDTRTELNGLWRPAGDLVLENVNGRVDLERVDLGYWLQATRPAGYLQLAIDQARLPSGQVPRIVGGITWEEARLEGSVHERLGRIGIEFEPDGERLLARVGSLEPAPIQVRGTIEADVERYEVDLWLRASPDRPDLAREIGILGERQADGQVRLRLSGAVTAAN
ncbi:MAG: hypothetical protein EA370_05515 [Wenzhouxiangella sp.]|nr:MAG: hypothetical protein EA370_05515 [Wenzhouxiangella sp.]